MKRKFLFVCFTDDDCLLTHAFWYAHELHRAGHEVRLLLEGLATRCLTWLEDPERRVFTQAFQAAREAGLLAGVCQAAASGCAGKGCARSPIELARELNLEEHGELNGHAGIAGWVERGYELTVF